MEWKNIVNIEDLTFETDRLDENYESRSASIGQAMGAKNLGFHIEILPSGKFSCPYHFHHGEEELFLVLEGRAMLRQNNRFREVGKGDLLLFGTGPEAAHQFYNHTDEDFRFLALSTREAFDICEYPDSGKVLVRKTRDVFRRDDAVDYMEGEQNPRTFWPADIVD